MGADRSHTQAGSGYAVALGAKALAKKSFTEGHRQDSESVAVALNRLSRNLEMQRAGRGADGAMAKAYASGILAWRN